MFVFKIENKKNGKKTQHQQKISVYKKMIKTVFQTLHFQIYENKFPVQFTNSLFLTQNEPLSVPINIMY